MASPPHTPHLPDALLHALAAGELDTVQRSTVEQHLAECPACRRSAARVAALVETMRSAPAPTLDEVSWQRMANQVRAELAREATTARPERRAGAAVGSGWRALAVGGAIAATALVAFWAGRGSTRAADDRPAVAVAPAAPDAGRTEPAAVAQAAARGVSLSLSPDARAKADATPNGLELRLDAGLVDLRAPADPARTITVFTPEFHAIARSEDFTVGYRAAEAFVEVRAGEVEVHGSRASDGVVRRGERRVIARPSSSVQPSAEGSSAAEGGRREPELRSVGERVRRDVAVAATDGAHGPRSTPAPLEPGHVVEPGRSLEPGHLPKPVRSSSEGETKVSIELPSDPIARAWLEASEAYYLRRDVERAIRLAQPIVTSGGGRPEVALAEELLCDGYIATHQPRSAVEACRLVLQRAEGAGLEERARAIHYQLATVYRVQLGDCATAMYHYGRAIVFGRTSLFDDEALLWRTHCALELQDLDAARRDLALLEQHRSGVARPEALRELEMRFEALSGARNEPGSRARTR